MADGDDDCDVAGDRLPAWVRADFGVELAAIERVTQGADAAADVWCGVSSDGVRYAVKWTGGGSVAGLLVPSYLAERGVPGVPAPVPSRSGRLWSEREGRRLCLMPWVSDDDALAGAMTRQLWTAYGAMLARVHASPVTREVSDVLPREDHTHERWASAIRSLDVRMRMVGSGEPADGPAVAVRDEWLAASDRIAAILERADVLGGELRRRRAHDVLCHGDAHLGNVLVADGRPWLIDWDDAVLAPRERDLLFVLDGVLYFAPVTSQQQTWFFDGYGPAEIDTLRLAYYRCVRAMEDLAEPAAQALDAGRDPDERAEALSIVRGVLSPTGLTNQALRCLHDMPDTGLSRDVRSEP